MTGQACEIQRIYRSLYKLVVVNPQAEQGAKAFNREAGYRAGAVAFAFSADPRCFASSHTIAEFGPQPETLGH